jgi:NADH-quinone oxidoreductase subunit N
MPGISEKLEWINLSLQYFLPELMLVMAFVILLLASLVITNSTKSTWIDSLALSLFTFSLVFSILGWNDTSKSIPLFNGMLHQNSFAAYLKLLFDSAAVLTVLLSWNVYTYRKAEYYALLACALLGAHLLVMSANLIMVFLSIELISLPSYLLTAFAFSKKGMEGALKYFLFGSVASAIMLYGMSLLYAITHTLEFTSAAFANEILHQQTPFFFISICFVLAGFLFKIASAPMHPWAPDVYEAAPTPVAAFFSVVPKLAGIGILLLFCLTLDMHGTSRIRWHIVLSLIALLTLTIGNLAALWQKNPKRMMAYSSIAQAGFLLIGAITLTEQGTQFMLFYGTVFLVANYLVFLYIGYFEQRSVTDIDAYAGVGKSHTPAAIFLLLGLLSLTGLPPTAGFMAKVFVFSSLWNSYDLSGSGLYLAVFIVGLLNTVISLFFYLKIPYQSFLRNGTLALESKRSIGVNLLGLVLVIVLLSLFFSPSGLMGWLNRITFAP